MTRPAASDTTVAGVVTAVRETLAIGDERPVEARHLLVHDLGFTSMDMLDLLFRLEDAFGIQLPEGTLLGLVLDGAPAQEHVRDGVLTASGRARLMALFHDTPPGVFPERIHVSTLSRFATVGAMGRLVESRCSS